ncbi:MAG: RDD family protein [Chitinophagaceae bacterium]|nr:RDD family protein [Chitinophagaceae bacterium]
MKNTVNENKVASKGTRMANYMVDMCAVLLIAAIVEYVYSLASVSLFDNWMPMPGIFFYIVYLCYYLLFEFFLASTPGKLLTRTTVKRIDGTKPSFAQLFIRNVMRLFPFYEFTHLFGLGPGLHDHLSKTTVVYRGR